MIDLSKLSGVSVRSSALAAAAVMALTVSGMASAAGPVRSMSSLGISGKAVATTKAATEAVLYDQTDFADTNGFTSQNFESSFDVYDNQSADDFTVPAGVQWQISKVVAPGFYNSTGPVNSVRVTFYKNKSNLPQNVVADFAEVVPVDDAGNLEITLPSKVKLKPGKYWISVQANMDFFAGGQWYWFQRTQQSGQPGAWQNPNDGFGSGCVTWTTVSTCVGPTSPDFVFRLEGKSKPL